MKLSEKQIQIVINAQRQIINKPKRAVVNSESSFVRGLIAEHDPALALAYWNWVCMPKSHSEAFENTIIIGNQMRLNSIDEAVSMPDWGYSGT